MIYLLIERCLAKQIGQYRENINRLSLIRDVISIYVLTVVTAVRLEATPEQSSPTVDG